MKRSIENSLSLGVYAGARQVGFARVVTDYATFAYIGDVFILESHRGRGLSKKLMRAIMSHPRLQGLRRWHLSTRDAHGLYRQYGFTGLKTPDRHMEKWDPDIYRVAMSGISPLDRAALSALNENDVSKFNCRAPYTIPSLHALHPLTSPWALCYPYKSWESPRAGNSSVSSARPSLRRCRPEQALGESLA